VIVDSGKRPLSHGSGYANEENRGSDNIRMERVIAEWPLFVLSYHRSNRGLLWEHAGQPNSKGR
jgi:hypothetical protein